MALPDAWPTLAHAVAMALLIVMGIVMGTLMLTAAYELAKTLFKTSFGSASWDELRYETHQVVRGVFWLAAATGCAAAFSLTTLLGYGLVVVMLRYAHSLQLPAG